ncbi:TonB-dependent receptor domain-containing protein [Ravibacter arvi]
MKFLSLLLLYSMPCLVLAQVKISGTVTDKTTREPLPFASVVLFRSADSASVSGVLTDEKGAYLFERVVPGKYFLQAQFIGYKVLKQDVLIPESGKDQVAPVLQLEADARLLDAVNVAGERQTMEQKIDRQVYRADKFLNSSGGTAVDVLRNMPSVSVNAEGVMMLRGSTGFLVLLNGRPVSADPMTVLSQLPANSIENIEVITAPSASFDPDGKSGIINITTKAAAPDSQSFSASVQGGLPSVRRFDNLNAPLRFGADVTYGLFTDKWEVSASVGFLRNDMSGRRVGDVHTTINQVYTSFPSDGERSFIRYNYTGRAAVTYRPDKKNALTAGFYTGYRSQSRRADIVYNNTKTDLNTGDVIGRINYFNTNIAKKTGRVTLGNLDFSHTFNNRSVVTLSGLTEWADIDGLTTNYNLEEPGRKVILQGSLNPGENPLRAYRLRADYVLNLGKGKLETGYQYRNQVQNGDFQYLELDVPRNIFLIVPAFSSTTRAVNRIHSVYSQYNGKAGRFTYNGGLRYEYAFRSFRPGEEAAAILNLNNLFPVANLQYEVDPSFTVKAAYSKRVQRSTNNELNPFPEREHSETLESGDPHILPEFIGLMELGISKTFDNGTFFANVYRQRIKNVVNRVNSIYSDTILNRIYTNAGIAFSNGLEAGTTLDLTKSWKLYAGGNLYHYKINGTLFNNEVKVNSAGWVYLINANTTVALSPTWQLQGSVNYLSKRVTAQGEDSRFVTPHLSLRKTFLKGRLAALLQWQNVDMGLFGTNQQRITTWGKDFFTTTNYIHETDIFLLNLSFNINQSAKKGKLPASEFGEREF